MSAWDDVMDASGDASRQAALKRYRAEVEREATEKTLRDAAEKIRDDARRKQGDPKRQGGKLRAADLIDPDKQ